MHRRGEGRGAADADEQVANAEHVGQREPGGHRQDVRQGPEDHAIHEPAIRVASAGQTFEGGKGAQA